MEKLFIWINFLNFLLSVMLLTAGTIFFNIAWNNSFSIPYEVTIFTASIVYIILGIWCFYNGVKTIKILNNEKNE